ncbi:hypothetical protein J6590_044107 [Homalodisca vitripennis]|nr:hypothetical protein J6590_044107 [Homalodisca vitripennis]
MFSGPTIGRGGLSMTRCCHGDCQAPLLAAGQDGMAMSHRRGRLSNLHYTHISKAKNLEEIASFGTIIVSATIINPHTCVSDLSGSVPPPPSPQFAGTSVSS